MASIEDPLISGTPEGTKNKVYLIKCAVPKCPTRAISGFAKFPAEPSLRDIWFKLCGLSVSGKSARICHAHFKPSDFSTTTKKRHLLPSALPSLLLPDMSHKDENGLPKITNEDENFHLDKENLDLSSKEPLFDGGTLEIERVEKNNPWSVEDATVFLKYCCPECEYSHQNLDSFTGHALENHDKAKMLFTLENGENNMAVTIKPELEFYPKEEIIDCNDNDYMDTDDFYDSQIKVKTEMLRAEVSLPKRRKKRIKRVEKVEEDISKQVTCEICFEDFLFKDMLRSHNKEVHMLGKLRRCSYCDYNTEQTGWGTLKDHIETQHPDSSEKKHFCEQCNKGFIYQHSLNRHKLSHNERIKHVCDICGVEYLSIQNFKEHMLFKHNSKDASDLVCEICGFSTISRLKLTVHIHAKHATGKHKQCSYCDFKTPWIQKLQIHIDVKHPDQGEKKFFCDHCPRSFIFEASLKKHMNKIRARAIEPKKRKLSLQCDYCEAVLVTDYLTKVHYKNHHPNQPILAASQTRYNCTSCSDFFFTEDDLEAHLNLKHEIETERKYCKKCKQPFKDQHTCQTQNKKKYKSKKYPQKKETYSCSQCSKTFTTLQNLQGHILSAHEKQFDFECEHCGKKLATVKRLQNHISQCHSSHVVCEICQKQISNPYELKRHKVFVHKVTEGAWFCDKCPKNAFFSKATFLKHMKDKH